MLQLFDGVLQSKACPQRCSAVGCGESLAMLLLEALQGGAQRVQENQAAGDEVEKRELGQARRPK